MADDKFDKISQQISDLRVDVSVVKTDVSYLKQTVQEVRDQAKLNAKIATEEAATTRDLFTGGRIIRWILITVGGLIGALFTIGRDTWKEIVRPWFQ